jgi:hypothetical protein
MILGALPCLVTRKPPVQELLQTTPYSRSNADFAFAWIGVMSDLSLPSDISKNNTRLYLQKKIAHAKFPLGTHTSPCDYSPMQEGRGHT